MPHPWVYSATITDGKITFRIEVTDLQTTVGAIEIAGIATQVNGAFAPISRITNVPSKANGDPNDPKEAGRYFVDVEAIPTQDHAFRADEDVTVFVRASKVWVTVLGPGSDDEPKPIGDGQSAPQNVPVGPTWGKHRADSHMSAPEGAAPVSSMFVQAARPAGGN